MKLYLLLLSPWFSSVLSQQKIDSSDLTCHSKYFCDGEIFKYIQMSRHTTDNKYFVDMTPARSDEEIQTAFLSLIKNDTQESFTSFLDENFYAPGYELDVVKIDNYPELPSFAKNLKDPNLKLFAKDIHYIWNTLVRKYNPDKLCKGCQSSLLPLRHNFVIPGGRFREFYYWDSYFVMEGLNLAGLHKVSKDIIMNFLDIVETYGLVPNGSRRYFLNRSQPPLLIPAVYNYIKSSGDGEFLKDSINTLVKEYQYWISNHTAQVPCPPGMTDCGLTRYIVNTDKPRPESYREDYNTVEVDTDFDTKTKHQLYADLAAGAETGWDYSSRWIPDAKDRVGQSQEHMLRGIRTSSIIPVDLNSIMYLNEITLGKMYRELAAVKPDHCGSEQSGKYYENALYYEKAAAKRALLMEHTLWNPSQSTFYDYNIELKKQNQQFTVSNYWPFWTDALTPKFRSNPKNYYRTFQELARVRVNEPGGTPVTSIPSKLQWDYPNVWAPLELVLVEGLQTSARQLYQLKDSHHARELTALAQDIASRFVQSSLCAWSSSGGPAKGDLFEKYNSTSLGMIGGGGEYHIQTGFGWTNGVISRFLDMYPDIIGPANLTTCQHSFNLTTIGLPFGKFKHQIPL